jgi:predicted transcriptional regulator
MNEMALRNEKTMTVREVAESLGCDPETVKGHVRELFPDLMQNGKTTYLDERQVTVILEKMKQGAAFAHHVTDGDVATYNSGIAGTETALTPALKLEMLYRQIDEIKDAEIAKLRAENAELRAKAEDTELAKLRVENAELRSKALTAGLITDEGGGVSMKGLSAVIGNPRLGPKALSFRLKLDLFIDGRNRPFRQTVDEGLMYRTKHGRLMITEKGAAYFKELYKDYDPITWRHKVRGRSII